MTTRHQTAATTASDYTPRSRGIKRRDLFLDAASKMFIDRGYEATSLQDVVSIAGGSLATLYRLFGNKEGLFKAVLERKFKSVFGEMELPAVASQDPALTLFNLGSALLSMILSEDAIGMHRLMIAEAKRSPRLREIFIELAPNRAKQYLSAYLKEEVGAGRMDIKDCELSASQFLEMVKGDLYMRQLLGEEINLTAEERKSLVKNAVDIFLRGVSL